MSVVEDNWEFPSMNKTDNMVEFSTQLKTLHDNILHITILKVHNCEANGQNYINELQAVIEENINLKQEITTKEEDYERHKKEYESYKHDQKLLSLEIKDTHEAFLMAKKYYKKFLKIYYTIEKRNGNKQTIFLQFFTESKKENEKYSVRLLRDTKIEVYDLLETNPKLDLLNELKEQIKKSNDVIGVLCTIRSAFAAMRNPKKQ